MKGCRELAGIEALERPAGAGHPLLVHAVGGKDSRRAGGKFANGRGDHPVLREHPQLVVQRGKVSLHALAGDRVDRLKLLECLGLERGRGGLLAGEPHERHGDERDCQERQQKPVVQESLPAPTAASGLGDVALGQVFNRRHECLRVLWNGGLTAAPGNESCVRDRVGARAAFRQRTCRITPHHR